MGQGVYQSQNMTVLAHLQAGHSITSWEAIQRWHITRLARCIQDLEDLDHPIQSEWEASNGKRYKRYSMPLPKGQLTLFGIPATSAASTVSPAIYALTRGALRATGKAVSLERPEQPVCPEGSDA